METTNSTSTGTGAGTTGGGAIARPEQGRAGARGAGGVARILSLLLGIWLFVSAFALHQREEARTNLAIVGLLAAAFAVAELLGQRGARWMNAILATWLLLSAWMLPYAHLAPRFHDAIAALVLFLLSLFVAPIRARRVMPGGEATATT